MKTLTVRFEDSTHAGLAREANSRRISVSEVIREACNQVPLVGADQPDREAVTWAIHAAKRQLQHSIRNTPQHETPTLWAMFDRLEAIERRMAR